jgi:lysophospholipase L1-like esterase
MGRLLRACVARRFMLIVWGLVALAACTPFLAAPPRTVTAATAPARPATDRGVAAPPMPLISRDLPTQASAGAPSAASAADGDYATTWRPGMTRAWLSYDLAAVEPARRGAVTLAWYAETGVYDYATIGDLAPPVPTAYRIEAHVDTGAALAPVGGWETLVAVGRNTLHSRQHRLDLRGYRWIRFQIVAAGNHDLALNLDLHDASRGGDDGWLICGSSSNAAAMDHNARGTGTFAQQIAAARPGRFPAQENCGLSGTTSADGARHLASWLPRFGGRYVALTYGLNDANRAAPGAVDTDAFYRNYVTMVEAILAAGKVPVVSTVPWARTASAQANLPLLNARIELLYATYPAVVRGPDLYGYFAGHQELISADDIHPTPEGMATWRRLWAERALVAIYGDDPLAATR